MEEIENCRKFDKLDRSGWFVGAHVSASGGVENAPLNAAGLGAKAFALFTKNQRRWEAPDLTDENCSGFKKNLDKVKISPAHILPHDSYLINLGNPDPAKNERSFNAFVDEIQRCISLGVNRMNFHPGSHLHRITTEECLELISNNINRALSVFSNFTLVIENTAGQGSNVGHSLEQLARLVKDSNHPDRTGICLDTCHLFAAGYDISSEKGLKTLLDKFDQLIGISHLKGVHLNDSKRELGSRVDRHAPLGQGMIGWEPFRVIMNTPIFQNMPLILETPDQKRWPEEIRLLYQLQEQ